MFHCNLENWTYSKYCIILDTVIGEKKCESGGAVQFQVQMLLCGEKIEEVKETSEWEGKSWEKMGRHRRARDGTVIMRERESRKVGHVHCVPWLRQL